MTVLAVVFIVLALWLCTEVLAERVNRSEPNDVPPVGSDDDARPSAFL